MIKPTHIREDDYYSKAQAAEVRGVSLRTIQSWIDRGWLKSIAIGGYYHIIRADELMAFSPPRKGPKSVRTEGGD